jgi:hypothetical protein
MEFDPGTNTYTSHGPKASAEENEREVENLRREVKRLRARVRELEAQLEDRE